MFDTANMKLRYAIKIEQRNLKYHRLNNNLIRKIKFEVMDSLRRYVDLKDPISMTLFLRSF